MAAPSHRRTRVGKRSRAGFCPVPGPSVRSPTSMTPELSQALAPYRRHARLASFVAGASALGAGGALVVMLCVLWTGTGTPPIVRPAKRATPRPTRAVRQAGC